MDREREYVHHWHFQGQTVTFAWVGNGDVEASRVYSLAFSPDGKILLVSGGPNDPRCWLPGGGIEAGERPEEALRRELLEEAAATVLAMSRLGFVRVDYENGACEYHVYYWCRVALAPEFVPKHEVVERKLVAPEDFLDTLFWGRTDPKAAMLLERALELERAQAQRDPGGEAARYS